MVVCVVCMCIYIHVKNRLMIMLDNVCKYSSPSIERPLPQKTTSSYRPLLPCTDALTVHTIKPPLEDHLFSETKLRWI